MRLRPWVQNLRRLIGGRPPWSPQREFAYYQVEPHQVLEHQRRQQQFQREAYLGGLRTLQTLGLLDAERLAGMAVLDLGAGECLLSAALHRAGAGEVWATDAVPKQIWAAAAHHAGEAGLHFVVADARDLPFADGSFDLVTAHLLLHHIEPLEPLLREVLRVLRPGGELRAFEPNPLLGALAHEPTSENEAPVAPRKVVAALRAAGFEQTQTEYVWARLGTGLLGPLSPSYRVRACRPGHGAAATVRLLRPLVAMRLPNLLLDGGCAFAGLARAQEQEILRALQGQGRVGDERR
ncbi:MAG: class I SAM-dependent methyltransferase [Myxococcales bacterium]|nr:methyltransferase domain-containing protein [Myxococcota bacterium]MDW8284198.1 class I SAM-dependent methyltransferase [Myxococcales bacterium]